MKANRVECDQCDNFIDCVLKEPDNYLSNVITNAKCKIGKRVLFRKPRSYFDDYGYIRICEDFKPLTTK